MGSMDSLVKEETQGCSLCPLDTGSAIQEHLVRLLTYLPGATVATIPLTPPILYEIGQLAARLNKTLVEVRSRVCLHRTISGCFAI